MNHIPQKKLSEQIESAKQKVRVGGLYSHYKSDDKLYSVLMVAILEANDELCVIYQAQYDEKLTFVRPLSSWLEPANRNGKRVPRFTLKD